MATKRFRLQYMFWLNVAKDDEYSLAQQIEELKHKGSFTKTIRDGIRLVCDLRAGRTDVLFELFPWVKNEIVQTSTSTSESLLQRHLERLEALMATSGAVAPNPQLQASSGPKAMQVKPLAALSFDDDDDLDTVILKKDTSTDSARNFINSMLNLQQ